MKTNRQPPTSRDATPRDGAFLARSTHDAVALPGCVVHVPLHVDALAWISRTLRCVEDPEPPPSRHFTTFDATFRVQTFDDIDVCVKVAAKALSLEPIAVIGLRELIVNAVEHGNLEIDFDQKSALLANGEWQQEIERRLASGKLGTRFAAIHLSRDENEFVIEITDQGAGFDWRLHLDPDTAPSHTLHGRGMSLAVGAGFKSIQYRGTGNRVVVRGACASDQDS